MISAGVSVIIVSYNVSDYLDKCIASLLLQKNIEVEIIVVDNNSSDGTVDFLKRKYTGVKVIPLSENTGFSAGNNRGIKEATHDFILLLNPDTELQETNVLEKMRDYLINTPDVGILAPCLLNTDGTLQSSFWNFPKVKDILLELFYLHRVQKKKNPGVPIPVSAASGATLFISKELVNISGGLDASMFWMEDTDLCYRATRLGKKVVYYPEVKIIHHGGKSASDRYSISIPNQVISKIKYFKKNGSRYQFIASDILSLFFILSRFIVFAVLSLSRKKMFQLKAKAYTAALKAYFDYNFAGNKEIIK
ncbi:MAG: glycosyltransferase family 2 protein [Bacteroidia bacterium]